MTAHTRETAPVIMIVGMPNSVHVARWVAMLRGRCAKLVLLPVHGEPPATELRPWVSVSNRVDVEALKPGEVGLVRLTGPGPERVAAWHEQRQLGRLFPTSLGVETNPTLTLPDEMVAAVRELQPDLIHSMEIQLAGYLTLGAKRLLGRELPPWVLSNWGSDLYLYHRLAEHRPILHELMRSLDGYLAECHRDIKLAHSLGLHGRAFNPMPASGGVDFSEIPSLDRLPRPSQRSTILVKGYHGWAGRGMHVLSALHLIAPVLRAFRIGVQFTSDAMREMIGALAETDGLDIEPLAYLPNQQDALERITSARTVVSVGLSDGIGTTLLEAMCYGAFPIKATTSCACEWIRNGTDGLIVDPHDVRGLADAIVRAVTDDALVDAAATRNRALVEERWEARRNGEAAWTIYRQMLDRDVQVQVA